MIVFKTEAVAQLTQKLKEAKEHDARVLAAHQEANMAVATERRQFLREANAAARSTKKLAEFDKPWPYLRGCPVSQAAIIQKEIDLLDLIAEDKFQARVDGSLMRALRRTFTEPRVC